MAITTCNTVTGSSTRSVGDTGVRNQRSLKRRRWPAVFIIILAAAIALPSLWAQAPAPGAQPPQRGNPTGMRIYIWAGPKTHGPGQHDYPLFLAEWSKLLTEHGANVDGSLHPPRAADVANADVIIIYVGDAGYLNDEQKAMLEGFVRRGGGLVSLHDSLCGPDPAYLSTFLGGAKKHGEVNFTLDTPMQYEVVDKSHPIMKDMTDIIIYDEAFFSLTWAKNPGIHPLVNVRIPGTRSAGEHKGELVPQMWIYEHTLPGGQPARAFVWMQGHTHANFSNYQIQRTLMRGIAWAAKRPVDELIDYVPPARPAQPGAAPARGQQPAP